jgi:hypothetical protein
VGGGFLPRCFCLVSPERESHHLTLNKGKIFVAQLIEVQFFKASFVYVLGRGFLALPGEILEIEKQDAENFEALGIASPLKQTEKKVNNVTTKVSTHHTTSGPSTLDHRREDVPKNRRNRRRRSGDINRKGRNKKNRSPNRSKAN